VTSAESHDQFITRRIRHGGNSILRRHATNAVAREDAAGNIKVDKEKSKKTIDRLAALVNAIAGPSCMHNGALFMRPEA
jgi:phage terminase large subunit-like protein